MKTWDDYKRHIREIDSEAAMELSLAEAEACSLSPTLAALSSTLPMMTSADSDTSVSQKS